MTPEEYLDAKVKDKKKKKGNEQKQTTAPGKQTAEEFLDAKVREKKSGGGQTTASPASNARVSTETDIPIESRVAARDYITEHPYEVNAVKDADTKETRKYDDLDAYSKQIVDDYYSKLPTVTPAAGKASNLDEQVEDEDDYRARMRRQGYTPMPGGNVIPTDRPDFLPAVPTETYGTEAKAYSDEVERENRERAERDAYTSAYLDRLNKQVTPYAEEPKQELKDEKLDNVLNMHDDITGKTVGSEQPVGPVAKTEPTTGTNKDDKDYSSMTDAELENARDEEERKLQEIEDRNTLNPEGMSGQDLYDRYEITENIRRLDDEKRRRDPNFIRNNNVPEIPDEALSIVDQIVEGESEDAEYAASNALGDLNPFQDNDEYSRRTAAEENYNTNQRIKKLRQQLRDMGYSEWEIDSFIKRRTIELGRENTERTEAEFSEFAHEHPVLATGARILSKPGTDAVSLYGSVYDYANKDYINPYSSLQQGNVADDAMFNAVSEDIEGKWGTIPSWVPVVGGEDFAQKAYSTLVNSADSALVGVLTGGVGTTEEVTGFLSKTIVDLVAGAPGGAIMGVGAAADKAREMALDGRYTKDQILSSAIAAGTFEWFFEAASLGNLKLFNNDVIAKSGIKSFLKHALVQAGINGSEEFFTEAANIIYDTAVNGDTSEYEQLKETYKAFGYGEYEAEKMARDALVKRACESGLDGLVQGLFMSGGNIAVRAPAVMANKAANRLENYARSDYAGRNMTDEDVQDAAAVANIINDVNKEQGRESTKREKQAVKQAAKVERAAAKGKEVSNATKGKLKANVINSVSERTEGTYFEGVQTRNQLNAEYFNVKNAVENKGQTTFERNGTEYSVTQIGNQYEALDKTFEAIDQRTDEYTAEKAKHFLESSNKVFAKTALSGKIAEHLTNFYTKDVAANVNPREYSEAYMQVMIYGRTMGFADAQEAYDNRAAVSDLADRAEVLTDEAFKQALQDGFDTREFKAGVTNISSISDRALADSPAMQIYKAIAKISGQSIVLADDLKAYNNHKLENKDGVQIGRTNVVVLNVNAPGGATRVLGHESYHYIKNFNPAGAEALQNLVLEGLRNQGVDIDKVLKEYTDRGYDPENALEELVADSMFDVLDEDSVRKLLAELDPGERKRFVNRIGKIVDAIAKAFDAYAARYSDLREIRKLRNEVDKMKEIRDTFFSELEKAGENFRKGEQAPAETKEARAREAKELVDKPGVDNQLRFSLARNDEFIDKAIAYNDNHKLVDGDELTQAKGGMQAIATYMRQNFDALGLPADIEGKTNIGNASYGVTEESTTMCPRSMALTEFADAVSDFVGRPLTVKESLTMAEKASAYYNKNECIYCYVAMDKKAKEEFVGRYIKERNAALKNVRNGMDREEAYEKYLNKRDGTTKPMRQRWKLWMDTLDSGKPFITAKQLASHTAQLESMNSKDQNMAAQAKDAVTYAQGASWAKKVLDYRAYNEHILKWKDTQIKKLNSHYGLRMYSFSDYSPAFILENMQMIMDASVKGLKGLAYTKEADFAKIFASTGININASVFAHYDSKTDTIVEDQMYGMKWAEAQELRNDYDNVGVVFVATNDKLVEWGLAQDWIDVVIPFHLVRTGRTVAEHFGFKDSTWESADKKTSEWKDGDAKSIYPPQHQNNKDTYLRLCEENHLTPRFERWLDNPNYMKLVNETRRSAGDTPAMSPVFDFDAAWASLRELKKEGGYIQHIGVTVENMKNLAHKVADEIKATTTENEADYELKWSTSRMDDEYFNALSTNGEDSWEVKEMVRQAAKAAGAALDNNGNPIDLYHGTRWFGWTIYEEKNPSYPAPFIYTSTKRSVAAHYAGDQNYAFTKKIGRKWRGGNSISDIIADAKTEWGTTFRKAAQADIDKAYEKMVKDNQPIYDKLEELRDNINIPDEDADYAAYYVHDLWWEVYSDFDFSDKNERTEYVNYLRTAYERYKEKRVQLREWYIEHDAELDEQTKKYINYLLGYDAGDAAIDIECGFLDAFQDGDILVAQNGRFTTAEDVRQSLDEVHNIGAYHLYGFLGDNPFEFDAKGAQFWGLSVPEIGDKLYDTDTVSKWAYDHGYTSVIMRNIYDYGDMADNYVFFNTAQIKSADPVTYDSHDEVIPLSERFNEQKKDIRYSTSRDNEYLKLAKNGGANEGRLQELVTDAARNWGAITYQDLVDKGYDVDTDGRDLSEPVEFYHGTGERFTKFKMSNGAYGEGAYFTTAIPEAVDYAREHTGDLDEDELFDNGNIVTVYLHKGAEILGYSKYGNGQVLVKATAPEQAKSSKLVEYDDAGNVIPLSKRFNKSNPDLRYSATREQTWTKTAEKMRTLREQNDYYQKVISSQQKLINRVQEMMGASGKKADLDRRVLQGKALDRFTARLIKETDTTIPKNELKSRLVHIFDYAAGNDVDTEFGGFSEAELNEAVFDLAMELVNTSQVNAASQLISEKGEYAYQEILDRIKMFSGKTVIVTDRQYREILGGSAFDNFADFKRHFPGINFVLKTKDSHATNWQKFWESITDGIEPVINRLTFVDTDAAENQPEALKEIYDAVTAPVNPYEKTEFDEGYTKQDAAYDLVDRIYESFFDLPELTKIDKVRRGNEETYEELRMQYKEAVEKARAEERNIAAQTLAEYKAQAQDTIATQKLNNQQLNEWLRQEKENNSALKHNAEALKAQIEKSRRMIERQNALKAQKVDTLNRGQMRKQIQKKVKKLNDMLVNPTDQRHIPKKFKRAAEDFVKLFMNNTSVFTKDQLSRLKIAYDAMAEKTNGDEVSMGNPAYDENIAQTIEELADTIDGRRLSQLNAQETKTVKNIVDNFYHTIRMENRMFVLNKSQDYQETGVQIYRDFLGKRKSNRFGGDNKALGNLITGELKPDYFFKLLDNPLMYDLYKNLRKGQDSWAITVKSASDRLAQAQEDNNYERWHLKEIKWNIRGTQHTITAEQMLSIYATFRRQQGINHILTGGIKLDDGTGKVKTILNPSLSEIKALFENMTPEMISYVEDMVGYLSSDMARLGNDISMKLYGYEKFNEKWYFPLSSDSNALYFTEDIKDDKRIKNAGMTKAPNKHANNAIVIRDFSTICMAHSKQMADYHSFVLPLEDLRRIYNYKASQAAGENIRDQIERVYGAQANKYIQTFMRDVNGGSRSEDTGFGNWMLSRAKKGAVFASMSVTVQQPSAIARAFAYINPIYFAKTTGRNLNINKVYDECMKYAPVAIIKDMGLFDTSVGRGTVDWMLRNSNKSRAGKTLATISDLASIAPEMADKITWAHIWEACKAEQKAKTKLTGEELLKAAGERFSEVIDRTQVYDSIFSRSQYMRSKSGFLKLATAFLAEPTTNVNLLYDALIKLKDGGKAGKAFAARATASFVVATVFNSLLRALVTAGRRDDDKKNWLEKYIAETVSNCITDPLTMVPYFNSAINVLQGYENSRMDTQIIDDLVKSAMALIRAISQGKADFNKYLNLIGATGNAFGIPAKNVIRDAKGAVTNVNDIQRWINGEGPTKTGIIAALLDEIQIDNKTPFAMSDDQRIYRDIIYGDTKDLDRLKAYYERKEKDFDKKEQAALKLDERTAEAAQALADGDLVRWNALKDELVAAGYSEHAVEKATQSVYTSTTGKKFSNKTITDAALDAGDNASMDMAYENSYQYYISQGKTPEEAEAAAHNYINKSARAAEKPDVLNAINNGTYSDIDKETKDLLQYGFTPRMMQDTLRNNYKDEYIRLYNTDRTKASDLKARMVRALVAIGYKTSKESGATAAGHYIDGWVK